MPNKISVVIIAKNEEDRIQECLKSVQILSDDIIVVDSGSTDDTVAKAREMGARVIFSDWKGFGPTKNYGNAKAINDWVLSLDSDEQISQNLLAELLTLDLKMDCVYSIDRQNYYLDQVVKYSGWSPDWVIRLFNKKDVEWNDSLVHEKLIIPDGTRIIKLHNQIIHNSYKSLKDHKDKIEKYASLRAQIWHRNGSAPSFGKRYFGAIWKGFKSYILNLGFLDGKAGWTIAKMNMLLVKRQLFYFDKLNSSKP